MGKRIIISESQLNVIREYEKNKEVLYHQFETKVRNYLKSLLENPLKHDVDKFFVDNDIKEDVLKQKLTDLGILTRKKEGFKETDGEDGKKHSVHYKQYTVKNDKFDDNMHKLYDDFFKDGERKNLNEEGEGAGATNGVGVGMVGSNIPDVPFGGVMKRPGYNGGSNSSGDTESTLDMTPALKRKDGVGGSISVNQK